MVLVKMKLIIKYIILYTYCVYNYISLLLFFCSVFLFQFKEKLNIYSKFKKNQRTVKSTDIDLLTKPEC